MSWTPSTLLPMLRERGIRPRRSLGQNFLLDSNFLDLIVREAGVGKEDGIIEIGTGPGNLTDRLAAAAGHVWSFEVDPKLHPLASELLRGRSNITLVHADGGDFERHVQWGAFRRMKVVSNLPYSAWQELLGRLLSAAGRIERYVLMIQRDACDRLEDGPGTRGYGPLSVIVQAMFTMRRIRQAAPEMFFPKPAVASSLMELRPTAGDWGDIPGLERSLRRLFSQRRKKCSGVWKRLTKEAIPDDQRVDQVAPRRLVELAARLR